MYACVIVTVRNALLLGEWVANLSKAIYRGRSKKKKK